ncbi:MAG: GTPase Era [Candidatus Sericytochromatia bacterium]|nr:MAG: GTPase Era [Candidatus Sericytochromatia bacterium]
MKKVGFVSIIGRPNVGKSTLLNHILREKIAITSNKPQTTRKNLRGIFTDNRGQIIFVDTPGLHKPHHLLGEELIKFAKNSLEDTDVILFVADASEDIGKGDLYILENILLNINKPVILLLNKIDKIPKKERNKYLENYLKSYNFKSYYLISAKHGDNLELLINEVFSLLPEGELLYNEDELTDTTIRDIVGELIREEIFRQLGDELPHCSAVYIESFKEKEEKKLTVIEAKIFVERESQKRIIIGKEGKKIKEIGENSRKKIEELLNNKVYLDLRVKVLKNWRNNKKELKKLGYIVE